MADKKLRIIFSGISTLYPGPAGAALDESHSKAFVLMAANVPGGSADGVDVDAHVPFVFIPESRLERESPDPSDSVDDDKLGRCHIFHIENSRVTLEPASQDPLAYFVDESRALDERPGSDDVAPDNDIRWLADLRELLPGGVTLKSNLATPGTEVAAVVELTSGLLQANFPCKSVQAMTFRDTSGRTIPGIKRVLASEFLIDMSYPDTTKQVTLRFEPLRSNAPITLTQLDFHWPDDQMLVIRIGNDTRPETKLAASPKRCDSRDDDNRPRLRIRENDFSLHYELLHVGANVERPLPHRSPHQTSGDGCKPARG